MCTGLKSHFFAELYKIPVDPFSQKEGKYEHIYRVYFDTGHILFLKEEIRHLEDLDKELEKLANNVEQRYDDLVMVKRHKSRRDRKGLGKRSQSVMGMPQESNWAQDHRTRRSQSVMGEWKSGAWDARSQGQTVMVGQRRDTESPEPSVSISHWLESGSDVAFSHLLDSGSDVELSHMMETRLQEQTVTVSQRRDTGSKDQEFAVSQGGRERRTTGYRSAEHRIKVTGPNKQWRAGHVVKGGTHNHRIKQSQSVQMMDTGSQDQAVTISKKKNRTRDW